MKKIIMMTLVTFTLSVTVMNSINAARRTQQKQSSQSRRVQRKKPTTAKESKQQIKEDTKALEQKVEAVQKAETPVAKAIARKSAYQAAQDLLADLKDERSFMSDVYSGYKPAQVEKARKELKALYLRQKDVTDDLEKNKQDLAKVTDEGYLWNSAMPGKEEEYNQLSLEVTKLKNISTRINRDIRNRKVIAGEEWSNAFRALVGSGVIGAAFLTGDLALTGGANTVALGGKAAALAAAGKDKAIAAWNMLPNFRSVPMPKIEVGDTTANVDGNTIEKTSLVAQFGDAVAESTWSTLKMAKDIAMQVTITSGVSAGLALAMKKLNELLEDDETTPAQLEAQNKKVQQETAKVKNAQK